MSYDFLNSKMDDSNETKLGSLRLATNKTRKNINMSQKKQKTEETSPTKLE